MYQIDTPDAATSLPTYEAAGTPGYFQDSAAGGGTTVPASWLNHIQEEFRNVIEKVGLVLDKSDDSLLAQAVGGAGAIASTLAASITATTKLKRAVITSATSRAAGLYSLVAASVSSAADGEASAAVATSSCTAAGCRSLTAASIYSTATGVNAATLATHQCVASGDSSVPIGSIGSYTSGLYSLLVASKYAEVADDYALAGGCGATGAAESGANRNLSWKICCDGGDAAFAGSLAVGADVDAGTSAAVTLDGATGDITADGDITASGLSLGSGSNEVCEEYTELWSAVPAGSTVSSTRSNTRIASDSIVLWSWDFGTGTEQVTPCRCQVSTGQVIFQLRNDSGGSLSGTWKIRYWVLNPA